jgi:hypothetical protein
MFLLLSKQHGLSKAVEIASRLDVQYDVQYEEPLRRLYERMNVLDYEHAKQADYGGQGKVRRSPQTNV